MSRTVSILFLFFLVPQQLISQVFPRNGSTCHYRRVGFSFPESKKASKYLVEIAVGNFNGDSAFKDHVIITATVKTNRQILEVPYFGKEYTWRVTYYERNAIITKGDFYHFSTGSIPEVDSCQMRLRILKKAARHKSDYVFVDGHKALYDMNGSPVWFLPMRYELAIGKSEIRDLKLSPRGTITFLQHEKAYEINYNGDTLWKTPVVGVISGDTTEHFHHEFTRLTNGHYMVLGSEAVFWEHRFGPASDSVETAGEQVPQSGMRGKRLKIDFGTVIEYDSTGKIIWYWKSSSYFMGSDLVNYTPEHRSKVIDVHENAFFFDQKDSLVYVSFKNISRILKVKYPSGEVLNTYGEIFKPNSVPIGNGLFCDQHAVKYSKNGYLYLYNNNGCNDSSQLPTVVILKEMPDGQLRNIWEYNCTMEGVNINPSIKSLKERQAVLEKRKMKPRLGRGTLLRATSGGNVDELPDGSLFVSMNTQYCKMFIVGRDKKIIWSAVPERYYPHKNDWFITPQQYRASIITRKQLDELIWNAEK